MRARRLLVLPLSVGLGILLFSLAGCNSCGSRDFCDPADCPEGQECNPDTDSCGPINCSPGFTRCAPGTDRGLERCNAQGDGYNPVGMCGPSQSCVQEVDGGHCDPPACAVGSARCEIDGTIAYCIVGAFENPIDCPTGEVCDPSLGTSCVPTECPPDLLFCDADNPIVRLCNAYGTGSTEVETCQTGDTCSNGSCFSMCQLAELERSFVGCLYYSVDLNNEEHDDLLQFDIVISNPHPAGSGLVASFVIETRDGPGATWVTASSDTVAPGTVAIKPLPDRHVEGSTVAPGLAYRITSDIPIVAYQFNSDDLNGAAGSSGASILLPKPALEDFYYVVSLPMATGDDALFNFGGRLHSSGFVVIGTEDGTNVTVISATNTVGGTGIPAMTSGDSYTTTLNEGDVLQIESLNLGDDVTGSTVVSDRPVAVFGTHECAVINGGTCDHIEEQMMPLTAWGTTFANTRIYHGVANHLWRIIASEDATTVTFEYGAGVNGLPQPSGSSVMLDAGEYMDFMVTGPSAPGGCFGGPCPPENLGDYYATSDKPIYVVQVSAGEANMVVSVPVDQWLPEYLFIAPPFFADILVIARKMSATITLDGVPVGAGEWAPVAAGYEVARRGLDDGAHLVSGSAPSELDGPPQVYISGEDVNCGYAYVGGLNVEVINPIR